MLDHAISRASDWFNLHADQRLKLMNFYVILLAGALTLFGASIKDNNNLLEVVLGMSVAVITFTFKNLDRRTVYL